MVKNLSSKVPTLLINKTPVDGISTSKSDVFYQIDCDQGCLELSKLLGWDQELNNLIKPGN